MPENASDNGAVVQSSRERGGSWWSRNWSRVFHATAFVVGLVMAIAGVVTRNGRVAGAGISLMTAERVVQAVENYHEGNTIEAAETQRAQAQSALDSQAMALQRLQAQQPQQTAAFNALQQQAEDRDRARLEAEARAEAAEKKLAALKVKAAQDASGAEAPPPSSNTVRRRRGPPQ